MPASTETTTTQSLLTQIYYVKKLLEELTQTLVFYEYTDKEEPENGTGPTVYWHRYSPMAAQTTPLNEGSPPNGSQITSNRVSAVLAQYGDYVPLSDLLLGMNLQGPNGQMDKVMELMTYGARLTVDTLTRNQAFADPTNTNFTYAAGKTSVGTLNGNTDFASASDIRKMVRNLKRRFVPTYDNANYMFIISQDQSYDLQGETVTGAWLDVLKYTDNAALQRGELGRLFGARIVETPNISTGSGGTGTIYECYMFGRHAVGAANFMTPDKAKKRFQNISLHVKELGSAGTADPLSQKMTIGYKVNYVSKCLENARVEKYRVGATA